MKLAPTMRFLVLHGTLGLILFPYISRQTPRGAARPPRPAPAHQILLVQSVIVGLAALGLSYRLRIDNTGLSRRAWGIWTTLPWQAFADGQVMLTSGEAFRWNKSTPNESATDAERPTQREPIRPQFNWPKGIGSFRRTLSLGYLNEPDYIATLDAVQRHWKRPADVDRLPEKIAIKTGKRYRTLITFARQGITIKPVGEPERHVGWDSVRRLRITRPNALSRGFLRMELYLPGERIALRIKKINGSVVLNWRDVDRSARNRPHPIPEFCAQYVPESKVVERFRFGCPRNRAEWRFRMSMHRHQARIHRHSERGASAICLFLILMPSILVLVFLGWNHGVAGLSILFKPRGHDLVRMLAAATMYSSALCLYSLPLYLLAQREHRAEGDRLRSWGMEADWI